MKTKFEWGFFFSLSLSLAIYIWLSILSSHICGWMKKTLFYPPKKLNLSVYWGNYNISNPWKPNLDAFFILFFKKKFPLSFLIIYHIPLFHPKFVNEWNIFSIHPRSSIWMFVWKTTTFPSMKIKIWMGFFLFSIYICIYIYIYIYHIPSFHPKFVD
jgi:hypothetical protein